MSLKSFHIAFIIVSSLLCATLGVWGWNEYTSHGSRLGLGLEITGSAGLLLLIPYYSWFRKKARTLTALSLLALLLSSKSVLACSACFGDPTSPLTKGLKMGIVFMLVVVVGVLTGIASIAFSWSRRAKALEQ